MKKDKTDPIAEFENPGNLYRGKPFWSWNGELRPRELCRQVEVMKEMGLGGYFMHSRSGLITEYLGDEWFDCVSRTADFGAGLGMENWLYDEDRWPSGSAGGKVTIDPQYRMKSLRISQIPLSDFVWDDEAILCFVADLDGPVLHEYRKIGKETRLDLLPAAQGAWFVLKFTIVPDPPHSNYNGTTYIDTMSEKAVRRFIELTHEEYAKRLGDRMGRTVSGIFSDEPARGHGMDNKTEKDGTVTCDMCYTDDFFEQFVTRYGYDARDVLPCLFYLPEGKRIVPVKVDYFDLACNLFNERFTKQIYDWCHAHGIAYTGHALHENGLDQQSVQNGSLMRFYQYEDIPGVDILTEWDNAYWVVKQAASVARQLGKRRVLSELYGCTGWQFPFRSHKTVGDWQALFGVNFRCHHLSWYTMEGEAKRDYPASILHQSAWYSEYSMVETYFARFGAFMAVGTPACDLLVLNPIESCWALSYIGWCNWIFTVDSEVSALNERYFSLFKLLAGNHIDFDYGEEQLLRDFAGVEADEKGCAVLRVGQMRYKAVLVSGMLTIRQSTLDLLEAFRRVGGTVIFSGNEPDYVNALASDRVRGFAKKCTKVGFSEEELIPLLKKTDIASADLLQQDGSEAKNVFLQVRRAASDTYVALVNTDRDASTGELILKLSVGRDSFCERFYCEDGHREHVTRGFFCRDGVATLKLSMEAAGSAFFRFTPEPDLTLREAETKITLSETPVTGRFPYRLAEPNVCVLDFARWREAGGVFSEEKEILKCDRDVRRLYGLELRGGEMVQPWFSKMHDGKIYGEIELEYSFEIDTLPEEPVYLAGERPEYSAYFLNGVRLSPLGTDEFWVDDAFKKMAVPAGVLKPGKNLVTVRHSFRKTTNLEAVYLLGAFGVTLVGRTAHLVPLPETLPLCGLQTTELPFYTGRIDFLLPKALFPEGRAELRMDGFSGGCVRLTVGETSGAVGWEPYSFPLPVVIPEDGAVLSLFPTRKNTFGPLHLVPAVPYATDPGAFLTEGNSWTDAYNLIESGIRNLRIACLESCIPEGEFCNGQ